MYRHFRAIAEAVDMPHILYNVPGRTVAGMSNDTILRLADIPNIVGIKDASGDIPNGADLLRRAPADFAVYGADDPSALALMFLGAHGIFSVTANVAPRLMREMNQAALDGDVAYANAINRRLFPLHQQLFVESNPIPVKWALAQMGAIGQGIRLPLTTLSPAGQAAVRAAMEEAGIASATAAR
jgi:4-hydroxy-tetrahydrodipicolinate synthase